MVWQASTSELATYTHFSFELSVAMIAWLGKENLCAVLEALQQKKLVLVFVPTLALMSLIQ